MKKIKISLFVILFTLSTSTNTYSMVLNDIKGHWAQSQIEEFVDLGYVKGYSDSNTFKPNNQITRAEFITILNNYFGLSKTSGKVFSDTKNHWAREEIDIAITNGVCNGTSDTTFSPNNNITREEVCVMIANYKNIADSNLDILSKYKDYYKVSSWAKNSIEGMLDKEYLFGYDDNSLKPKNNMTRAEAVVTLNRIDNNDGTYKNEPPQTNTENQNKNYSGYNDESFKEVVFNEMLRLVNIHRQNNGAGILAEDENLKKLSNAWSKYMVSNDFFSHTDPKTGEVSYEIFPQYGTWNAENIAMLHHRGQANDGNAKELAAELFDMWKKSPGHNKNMLDKNQKLFGFGLYAEETSQDVWIVHATQNFKR